MNRLAIIFFIAYALVLVSVKWAMGNEEQWRAEGRDTFEIACYSLDAAVEFASGIDYNRCFLFEELYGFQPWGFLEPVVVLEDWTIYHVTWGNTDFGIYAVK